MKKNKAESLSSDKIVTMAIVDLLRHKVFYGHILQQLQKISVEGQESVTKTAAVGKRLDETILKLYVNKDFVKQLFKDAKDEDQAWGRLLGTLEHETLHIIFDHLMLKFSDKQRGNIAVDCVVNSCIEKSKLPQDGIFSEMFGFPENKSSFWYYKNLENNKQYNEMNEAGQFGAGGKFGQAIDSHDGWKEAMQDPIVQDLIKDMVKQAKELCGADYGDIPSEVIEQIGAILKHKKPVIPWNKVLRTFVASSMESELDYTMKRRSRRFGTRPGTRKEDVLDLAIGVDTSASISDIQLIKFFNEIRWIWKNGAKVTIFEADAAVSNVSKYNGRWNGKIHGRGGTNLEPLMKEVEGKFDAVIYFTDGFAPKWKKKYKIATLWVLTHNMSKNNYPWPNGRVVKISNNKNHF